MADLLVDMRDYLVAASLVRRPRESTPAGKPPLWLDPQLGTPAPGEGKNATEIGATLVIGAYLTGGIAARPFESSLREDTVEFRIRSTGAILARDMQALLRAALIDRRNFQLGTRTVVDCEEWRPLQHIGSDAQSVDYSWAVLLQTYVV